MARACSSTFMDAHSAWDLKGFDCSVEFLSSSLSSFCAVVCKRENAPIHMDSRTNTFPAATLSNALLGKCVFIIHSYSVHMFVGCMF